jgi:hypothetical protein
MVELGEPALTAFFGGECVSAGAALTVLRGTATIQVTANHVSPT